MRLVRVRAGVCAPCTHVYSPFSVFEHTYMCTYTHTHAHTHTHVPSFLSFPLNSSFFSILLLSVRGNKRTPICPRKTKNLFHTRRRFLAFSAAPRHQIPSLFSPCLWGTGIRRNNENTNYGSTGGRSSRRDNLGLADGRLLKLSRTR